MPRQQTKRSGLARETRKERFLRTMTHSKLKELLMRSSNRRVVFAGVSLLVLAVMFFIVMLAMAPRSSNQVELMRIVGTVSGVVGGLAIAMMVIGTLKKPST
jgi:hypothetical protein